MRYQDLLPEWNKSYIQFIKNHEKNNWSWEELSCNENIIVESIKQNPELPWSWNTMSSNNNITFDFVLENIDKPWNWYYLSCHPNITIKNIIDYPQLNWVWSYVSKNPNLKLSDVISNPDKDWSWEQISRHKNITIDDILSNNELPWSGYWISLNPNITPNLINKYDNISWDWDYFSLCHNENMTFDFMIEHHEFFGLCLINEFSNNITIDILHKHTNKVNWERLSHNKNININILLEFPEKLWDWQILSQNINFTDIRNHPELPWDYKWIIYNKNIKLNEIDILLANHNIVNTLPYGTIEQNKQCIYRTLSKNYNISFAYINKHIEYIDFVYLSGNNLNLFKQDWIKQYRLKHIKALQIQRYWRLYTSNPSYSLARKLIIQNYNKT